MSKVKTELINSIKQAQDIVESSGVKGEYAKIAFEVSLNHLIGRIGQNVPVGHVAADKPVATTQQPVDSVSYNDFLDQKQPKNDYEITACIVSYMTDGNVLNTTTKEELVGFIHQNPGKIKGLRNLNDVIRHTRDNPYYSYIETVREGGEIRYRLSAIGKQLVDRLPERKTVRRQRTTRSSRNKS